LWGRIVGSRGENGKGEKFTTIGSNRRREKGRVRGGGGKAS